MKSEELEGQYDSPKTPITHYELLPPELEEAALDAIFGHESHSEFKPFEILPPNAEITTLIEGSPPAEAH